MGAIFQQKHIRTMADIVLAPLLRASQVVFCCWCLRLCRLRKGVRVMRRCPMMLLMASPTMDMR